MKTKTLLLLCVTGLLTACATPHPQLTREEWLSVASREYVGVTRDQVLLGGEKLFRLADGDDFKFVHTDEGLYATRNWGVYMVLAAARGTDYWMLKTVPTEKGIKATVQVNIQTQTITPMATTGSAWTATTSPMTGAPVDGTAIYDVFWARMDYLLGKRQDWMTCEIADDRVKRKIVWGTNEALCNSFNVNDDRPASPIEISTH